MSPSVRPGVDEIPLGDHVPGRLFLTGLRCIAPDPDGVAAETVADRVLCLVEDLELDQHAPTYGRWLASAPLAWRLPIPDYGVPTPELAADTALALAQRLGSGESVVVHCFGGIGRTSLISSLALVALGWELDEALDLIGRHRTGAGPERPEQRAFLNELVDSGRLRPPT